MIYFFYDSEDTTEDEVITELDKGIQYCLNYIPDELRYKYINVTLFDKFLRYKLCDCADNSTCYKAQYRPPEMFIRVVCAVGVVSVFLKWFPTRVR